MKYLLPLLFVFGSVEAQIVVDQQQRALETSVEDSARKILENFLGPEVPFVLAISATPYIAPAIGSNAAATTKSDYTDLGYLPFPVGGDSTVNASGQPVFRIRALSIEVRVSDKVKKEAVAPVEDLLNAAFRSYRPSIKIETAPFPQTAAERKIAEDAEAGKDGKDGTAEKEGPGFFEENRTLMLSILGLLGIAALVAAAFLLGRSVLQGLSIIAEGLKSLKPSAAPPPQPEASAKSDARDPKEAGRATEKTEEAAPPPMPEEEYNQHIFFVRHLLTQEPTLWITCVGSTEDELRGLRWLLTILNDEERSTVGKLLGPARLKMLDQIPPSKNHNPFQWIQHFMERLTVRRLQGAGLIERALPVEDATRLYGVDPGRFENFVKESSTPALWRLASDILPAARYKSLLKGLDENAWASVLESGTVDEEQIQAAYTELRNGDVFGDETAGGLGEAQTAALVEPLAESVRAKTLGEDDRFLESLEARAPALVDRIRELIWTPSRLKDVPKSYLDPLLENLGNEQLFSMILTLPSTWSTYIEGRIPEGRRKTIVMDLVREAKKANNPNGYRAATQVSRNLLEFLRREHGKGKFRLSSEEKAA